MHIICSVMRLQLWSPHQSSPTLQTTTQTLTPEALLTVTRSLTCIIQHTQDLHTQSTLITDTQPTLIPHIQTSLTRDTTLTPDISRIRGTQHQQIQGFQVTQTD